MTSRRLLVLLCAAAALPARADDEHPWRITAWLGGGGVGLGEVKSATAKDLRLLTTAFPRYFKGSASDTVTETERGATYGAEIGRLVQSGFGVGFALGGIKTTDMTAQAEGAGAVDETMTASTTLSTSVAHALASAWLEGGSAPGLFYRGALAAGPAWASMAEDFTYDFASPRLGPAQASQGKVEARGAALWTQVEGTLGWAFNETFGIYALLGYHVVTFKVLRVTKDVDWTDDGVVDLRKGEAFADADGTTVPFDFGGVDLKLGIRIAL